MRVGVFYVGDFRFYDRLYGIGYGYMLEIFFCCFGGVFDVFGGGVFRGKEIGDVVVERDDDGVGESGVVNDGGCIVCFVGVY